MSLLFANFRKRIEGHKYLTDHKEVKQLADVDHVYIPLANCSCQEFDILVEAGEQVKVGTNLGVRNDGMVVPVFSSVSGIVKEIKKMSHPLGMVDHVVIENDHKGELEELQGIDYKSASVEDLVTFTMNKGIIGCGGAGFPTYVKYKNVKDINKVIINAVECEPYITADYKEIDNNLEYLIDGALAMQKMASAKDVVIAIKKNKKQLIEKMQTAFKDTGITIKLVPDEYPMGWERSLIRYMENKEYENRPSEIGIIVNNSTTAIKLGQAMETGLPIVDKIVTVSGDAISNQQNFTVKVGTQVKELIKAINESSEKEVNLIAGGPMMGKAMKDADFVITANSNAITIVNPKDNKAIACLRCGACSNYCPAGLQPVRILEAFKMRDFDELKRLEADKCIECGLCSFVCPSKIEVSQGVLVGKRIVTNLKK